MQAPLILRPIISINIIRFIRLYPPIIILHYPHRHVPLRPFTALMRRFPLVIH